MFKKNYITDILETEKGLSLVDALIGVMLIGLIGLFLMGSFRTFLIGARTSSDRAQALNIAQQVLEDFRRNERPGVGQDWTYTPTIGKYRIIPTLIDSNVAGLNGKLVACQVRVQWVTPQGTEFVDLVGYYNQ